MAPAAHSGDVSFFATCHPGLEEVVAAELRQLGYRGIEPSKAGVAFRGRRVSDGYAANLWLRSAIRVLVLLAEGPLGSGPTDRRRGGQALYDFVYEAAPWHELVPPGSTFSVAPRLYGCTDLFSTQLVWSRVKDAVCDSIRQHRPDKPDPPERGCVADVPLYITCHLDWVKVFRDMSGESLHRRGYRDVMHRAALNEAAAAGVLALAGWPQLVEEAGDGEDLVLADPMCGSGTLLIEAALMARGIAPGLMRSLKLEPDPAAAAAAGGGGRPGGGGRLRAPMATAAWPFQRWGDYDAGAWWEAVDGARAAGAHSLAVRQARKAGVDSMIELTQGDCGALAPPVTPNLVVCNPPWGGRLAAEAGDERRRRGGAALHDEGYEGQDRDDHDHDGGGDPGEEREGGGGSGEGWGEEGGGPETEAYLEAAWRSLDSFLYRHCPGASAFVLSGNDDAFRYLKLKPSSKQRLVLGGVGVQVAGYRIRDAASRVAAAAAKAALPPRDPDAAAATSASPAAEPAPEHHQQHTAADAPPSAATAEQSASRSTQSPAGPKDPRPVQAAPAAASAVAVEPSSARRVRSRAERGSSFRPRLAPSPPPPAIDPHADDGYWLSD
ncbi:hypothetical protein GPECTOR_209g410 [Gonium pectorale]|uniref:Uncharacterized protein n=1 Tax=Gonium pectorale TaxID=33097 RepID=A0A150FWU2_GONPE|nr:hypothetical protein GPECTOR_209g410 [Gonium pectorale]|eukprot:KXZ42082.1 hypothetical protein GPECTOR_209g410 [Gonium pectorale]